VGFDAYLTDVGGVMQRQVSASLRAQAKQSMAGQAKAGLLRHLRSSQ
jgi:hypothetical protein